MNYLDIIQLAFYCLLILFSVGFAFFMDLKSDPAHRFNYNEHDPFPFLYYRLYPISIWNYGQKLKRIRSKYIHCNTLLFFITWSMIGKIFVGLYVFVFAFVILIYGLTGLKDMILLVIEYLDSKNNHDDKL